MAGPVWAQDSDLIAHGQCRGEYRGEYFVSGPAGCGNCHSLMGPEGCIAGQELSTRLEEASDAFTAIAAI